MLEDSSFLMIKSTSTLGDGTGGVWHISLAVNSSLHMSGGQVYQLDLNNYAKATLSGGLVQQIWSYQSAWKLDYSVDPPQLIPNPHITIIYSGDLPTVNAGNILTGLWGKGDPFSIKLHDVSGYSPVIENIQFQLIPEPTSLLLFCLGGLMLKWRLL